MPLIARPSHTRSPHVRCLPPCSGTGTIQVPADEAAFLERFHGLPLTYVTRLRAAWAIQACLDNDLTKDRTVACPTCTSNPHPRTAQA